MWNKVRLRIVFTDLRRIKIGSFISKKNYENGSDYGDYENGSKNYENGFFVFDHFM